MRINPRMMSMKKRFLLFLAVSFLYLSSNYNYTYALEANFTPAPDKDTGSTDGPLPQSQNQRNQLLQLDQMIAQSSNPQETLMKVAESNGMKPEELGDLLMRNRRDMQMAQGGAGGVGGMGAGTSIPRKVIRLLSTFLLLGLKSASAHPRSATFVTMAFLTILYVTISAPRNGVVLSYGNGLLSSGYTTLLPPPNAHLQTFLSKDKYQHLDSSMPHVKAGSLSKAFLGSGGKADDDDEDVIVQELSKKQKKTMSMVVTARRNVPFEALLPSEEELELMHEKEKDSKAFQKMDMDEEDVMQFVQDKAWDDSVELAFTSAESIIAARRFSEYIAEPSNRVKFVPRSNHKKNDAALVLKQMGDWKRYGVQPLRVAYEEEEEDVRSVIFYTLKGGHFDGELKVSVSVVDQQSQSVSDGNGESDSEEEEDNENDHEAGIVVNVTLIIPKNGRKISARLASKMVSLLADSIVRSTMTAARQTLSRRLQSTIYRGRAKSRASEKRHIAFENTKKMEEMAKDRRRRWQRTNSDAGRYRPTGIRRPDGGPSRSF